MENKEFLDILFSDKTNDLYILLWELENKKSFYFKNIDDAKKKLEVTKNDIYFGCGLRPKNLGSYKKGSANEISAIPGLWADIDISDSAHKKQNLPQSLDDAFSLIIGHGWDPTLIIYTGHGIHAYWLFKELWVFESDDERQQAADLSQRLHHTILDRAETHGWTIDNVSNLDRILRPPGTFNCKNNNEIMVQIHAINNDLRYNPSEFDELLVDLDFKALSPEINKSTGQQALSFNFSEGNVADEERSQCNNKGNDSISKAELIEFISKVKFDWGADVDPEKFSEISLLFAPNFNQSWKNKRNDLKDNSASAYDYSLAIYAKQAGWPDQETLDLLINHRRIKKHDMKYNNKQYYARTIIRATRSVEKGNVQKKAEQAEIEAIASASDTEKKKWFDKLSYDFNVSVFKIEKYLQEKVSYNLLTDRGKVSLPDVNHILSFKKFRARFAEVTDIIILPKRGCSWEKTAQILLNLAVDIHVSHEDTLEGRVKGWIRDYLYTASELTFEQAASESLPFKDNGVWYIFTRNIREFIYSEYGKNLTVNAINKDFRQIGLSEERFDGVVDGKRTSKCVWGIPTSVFQIVTNDCCA